MDTSLFVAGDDLIDGRVQFGSPSDLLSFAQNVGSWGTSGRQFRAAGLPNLAIYGLIDLCAVEVGTFCFCFAQVHFL